MERDTMSYQIITDSCCDFTEDVYTAMNVVSVPLSVMWGGRIHGHFSNQEALQAFYRQMRSGLAELRWGGSPRSFPESRNAFTSPRLFQPKVG